jgi:hypothetical protein
MAKRKRAKSKTAKSKTVKKKSAKTAKKRTATKRAKTKVAKRKTAKRKTAKATTAKRKTATRKTTTKRTAPPRTTGEHPCKPQQEERNRLRDEEKSILDQLSDSDIPPETRQRLQQLLAQTRAQLMNAQRELNECMAQHGPPMP